MKGSLLTIVLVVLVGCNRAATPPATAPSTQTATKLPPLGALQCKLAVLAPLVPKRITHLTVDPSSNVYFVQESDDGSDTMFIIGSEDVSIATPLSARGLLAAMDEKGSGNIQSIAAGSDGNIYFYFTGGTKKKTIACLGRFETRTGLIRILAREQALASGSDFGASLALARGTVVPAGKTLWFWLHHSDGSAMFQLKPGEFPRDGEIHLPKPTVLRSEDGTLTMSRADFMKLSPGAGDSMLLLDEWTAALWKIDVTGSADVVQALVGLPKLLSAPGANRVGDIMLFAAASELIEPRVDQRVAPVDIDTHYPSLLVLRNGVFAPIARDDILADPSFPLYSMQLEQTLYEPGRDTWIGYDSSSGQIVRMRLEPRRTR